MVKDFEIIGEMTNKELTTENAKSAEKKSIIKNSAGSAVNMRSKSNKKHYVLCVSNEKYPASLDARKIYKSIPDPQAEAHGQIRVIDESGEDYLYPQDLFIPIEVPKEATRVFARGS